MPPIPKKLAHKRQRRRAKEQDLQAQELVRNGAVILSGILAKEGEPPNASNTALLQTNLAQRALIYARLLQVQAEKMLSLADSPAP